MRKFRFLTKLRRSFCHIKKHRKFIKMITTTITTTTTARLAVPSVIVQYSPAADHPAASLRCLRLWPKVPPSSRSVKDLSDNKDSGKRTS